MDAKDFEILAELHRHALASLRELGVRTGLSAPSVRARLLSLETRGVLQGYFAYPDASVFGLHDVLYFFGGEHDEEAARRLLDEPDVAMIALKADGGLTLQTWTDDAAATGERLAKLVGSAPVGRAMAGKLAAPEPSPLDWRIIRACIEKPRHSPEELVALTGLAVRTATRRRDALIGSGALTILPLLALKGAGEVVYQLAVFGSPSERTLNETVGEHVLIHGANDPPGQFLLCHAPDIADVTLRTGRLAKAPGVESVRVTLNRQMWLNTRMMLKRVGEKLGKPSA